MRRIQWKLPGMLAALVMTGETPPALGDDRQRAHIESIVITARRVKEQAHDAPLSVRAFSAEDLELLGYADVSRLDESVVNMQFDPTAPITGSSNAAEIYIRGVGQSDFLLTTDPGVGLYLDGVYIARSIGGVLSLLDVERVEVIRGPQGTLYGRNTIGGAINVISARPAPDAGGSLELSAGNLDQRGIRGYLDLPLVQDALLARLSLSSERRDGHVDRLLSADETGEIDRQSGRLSFSWLPRDSFSAYLDVDATRARGESAALTTRWEEDPARFGRGALTDLYNEFVAPGTGEFYDARWLPEDDRDTYGTGPARSDLDVLGAALTLEAELASLRLRYIGSYRELDATFGRDPDNSPLTIVHTQNDFRHSQWSQELQLSGTAAGAPLQWLAGLYLFGEDGTDDVSVPLVSGVYEAIGVPLSVGGRTRVENSTAALFGHASYDLSPAWRVSAGLRYSVDQKQATVDQYLLDTNQPLIGDPQASEDFNDLSPMVSLEYRWRDDDLFYLSIAKGHKSGGFTGRYVEPTAALQPFDPEELVSWEAGMKSSWPDTGLRASAAVFFSRYEDIQILIFDGVAPQTRNAAEGEITGAEFEVAWVPVPAFSITAGLGYTDARYTRLDSSTGGLVVPLSKDDNFVNTPQWSTSLSLQYSRDMAGRGTLNSVLGYSWRDDVANDAINTPELIQGDVHLVNARLDFTPQSGNWVFSLYGRNLGDADYIVSGAADKPTFGTLGVVWAAPREWGASVRMNL